MFLRSFLKNSGFLIFLFLMVEKFNGLLFQMSPKFNGLFLARALLIERDCVYSKKIFDNSGLCLIHKIISFESHKVTSSNTSRLKAHAGFFRLLMKGIFGPYVP